MTIIYINKVTQLMSQDRTSLSIYHDLEKNRYYRINKDTGEVSLAHKDGSLPRVFKPDVTGNHYKIRNTLENSNRQQERKLQTINKRIDQIKRSVPVPSQKIFRPQRLSPLKEESAQQNRRLFQSRGLKHSNNGRVKSQMSSSNDYFLTGIKDQEGAIEKQHSHIGPLLSKFCKLNELKIYQNHCFLQKDPGTIIKEKLKSTKGFRETNNLLCQPLAAHDKQKKSASPVKVGSDGYSRQIMQKQLRSEKKLFLQFHPNFQERENTRLIHEQIERKKNMKSLQKLYIQQTAKQTNHIYTSDKDS